MDTGQPNLNSDAGTTAVNYLAEILRGIQGTIRINFRDSSVGSITLEGNRVLLDVTDASVFGMTETDSSLGFFEGLKTAKKLGEILNAKGLTLSIHRKGKNALTIGREATPTVSSLLTGSDDIQVDSVREVAKLGKDLKKRRRKVKKPS